jgi:hypothetical protein
MITYHQDCLMPIIKKIKWLTRILTIQRTSVTSRTPKTLQWRPKCTSIWVLTSSKSFPTPSGNPSSTWRITNYLRSKSTVSKSPPLYQALELMILRGGAPQQLLRITLLGLWMQLDMVIKMLLQRTRSFLRTIVREDRISISIHWHFNLEIVRIYCREMPSQRIWQPLKIHHKIMIDFKKSI